MAPNDDPNDPQNNDAGSSGTGTGGTGSSTGNGGQGTNRFQVSAVTDPHRMAMLPGQLRLPEFHGDPLNFPLESWDKYLAQIQLAYASAGLKELPETMRTAHLLSGLRGKAKQFYELNPEMINLSYGELSKKLAKKFGKPNVQGLIEIGMIVQKPEESVTEYLNRLKEAARAINAEDDYLLVTREEAERAARGIGQNPADLQVPSGDVRQHNEMFQKFRDSFIFHHFIRGLQPAIKQVVLTTKPRTLDQAYKAAVEHEQYLELYGNLTGEVNQAYCNQADATVSAAAKQLQELNTGNKNVVKTQSTQKPFNRKLQQLGPRKNMFMDNKNPNKNRLPFQVGKTQNSLQDQGKGRCFFCARPGHLAKDCLTKARYMKKNNAPPMQRGMSGVQSTTPRRPANMAGGHQAGKYPSYSQKADKPWATNLNNNSKNGVAPPKLGGFSIPMPITQQRK